MGCIPSKSSQGVKPKPGGRFTTQATVPRASSTEQMDTKPPLSPTSIETKEGTITPSNNMSLPPRIDYIPPSPKPSNTSLRRQKAEHEQTHQENTVPATVLSGAGVGVATQIEHGVAVTGGIGVDGCDASGCDGAGGDGAGGGDGGGGD